MRLADARCFVFDFDGTLAPNLDLPELRRQVVELTLAEDVPAAEFTGNYIIEIIDAATAWLVASRPAAAEAYFERAHAHVTRFELEAASRLEPFPEVRGLLGSLRQAQRLSAVVTRNCEQAVRNTFPDIDDHLDLLLARDNVEHYKPDPRHLHAALTQLDSRPQEAVMVGDGAIDMRLGKTLGLKCVGVLTGSNDRAALHAAGADVVLQHVADLTEMVVA